MAGKRCFVCRIGVVAVLLATSALAGCAEYMDRKDTIAFSAAEAKTKNEVAHMIDPWPVHAANRNIPVSGERTTRAVRRLYNPPTRSGTPGTVINVGR